MRELGGRDNRGGRGDGFVGREAGGWIFIIGVFSVERIFDNEITRDSALEVNSMGS